MFLSKKRKREQSSPLNEARRALVEKKFEILRQASFGFTHDRLLHIQEEDLKGWTDRSEEHTSELQSQSNLVCRLLLEKKKTLLQRVSMSSLTHTASLSHAALGLLQ